MKYSFVRNDISKMETDAIVLPANPKLRIGSGTSKAIFENAGIDKLKKACKEWTKKYGDIWVGSSVPTLGYDLPAKYIIHSVVPAWVDGDHNEYVLLCSAYISALELADVMGCRSIAIPVLASGNNRFDIDLALDIAVKSIEMFEPENDLSEAMIVLYGHRVVKKVKDRGFEIDEIIDTAYELGNDERIKPIHEKAADEAIILFDLYVKDGFIKAIDYLEDPETADRFHKKAAELIKKEIPGGDKIINFAMDAFFKAVKKK